MCRAGMGSATSIKNWLATAPTLGSTHALRWLVLPPPEADEAHSAAARTRRVTERREAIGWGLPEEVSTSVTVSDTPT